MVKPHARQPVKYGLQRQRDRLVERLCERGVTDAAVLAALARVPRHLFVDEALAHHAYEDKALPIGHGQTISQPFVVARMTELLWQHGPLNRVLEIGTGCGYQTAVLAELGAQVYTVERIRELQARARQRLRKLGYHQVLFDHSNGHFGWSSGGEFDGIVVTCAAEKIPPELLRQLAVGGTLVMPVGGLGAQRLVQLTQQADGAPLRTDYDAVRFVPLVSKTQPV